MRRGAAKQLSFPGETDEDQNQGPIFRWRCRNIVLSLIFWRRLLILDHKWKGDCRFSTQSKALKINWEPLGAAALKGKYPIDQSFNKTQSKTVLCIMYALCISIFSKQILYLIEHPTATYTFPTARYCLLNILRI